MTKKNQFIPQTYLSSGVKEKPLQELRLVRQFSSPLKTLIKSEFEQTYVEDTLLVTELIVPQEFGSARDRVGEKLRSITGAVRVNFKGLPKDMSIGALCGIELSEYRFLSKTNRDLEIVGTSHLDRGEKLGSSVNLSRHLVSSPANTLTPDSFVKFLETHFKSVMKVTVWDRAQLTKEKMGLLLSVGQGSHESPYLVKLSYRGHKNKKSAPIAFVGKGITFDTGGLDLKPPASMRLMKKDMGGAATIAGVANWVKETKPAINIDFYFAIAENSISDRAMRPGDVFTSRNGVSVEIHNTDAEGRLVLADALCVAVESKPKYIINTATLTGAMRVALGANIAGYFCNDTKLAEKLESAAEWVGESIWELPIYDDYSSMLKSNVADCVNCSSGGFAGSITAALFLKKFVGDTPWAHFDIYCWNGSPQKSLSEKGGSGQMVQTLIRFLGKI